MKILNGKTATLVALVLFNFVSNAIEGTYLHACISFIAYNYIATYSIQNQLCCTHRIHFNIY